MKLLRSWWREIFGGNMWLCNCIMETDFIQCQPNTTKKKKYRRANRNHSNSDAMQLIAMFLFLQLCKCDYVPSDYIVCILYLTRKHNLQNCQHYSHYSHHCSKSPSCFKVKEENLNQHVHLYVKLSKWFLWMLLLSCWLQLFWHAWNSTCIILKLEKAKPLILATTIEFLFIPATTFLGCRVTGAPAPPTLWHHWFFWRVPVKRGPLNWVT